MTPRLDTRQIVGVAVDSSAFTRTLDLLQAGLPNEAAVCYTGALRDTTVSGTRSVVLHLTAVRPALVDSTNQFHVYFPAHGAIANCIHPAAIAHSHPYSTGACEHSYDDARLLFYEREALVSLVWCGDGELQTLFQDGRRMSGRWR